MKVLKWIGEKIADNIAGVVLTAIGGVLVVYLATMWEYTQAAWTLFTTPAQMSMGFVVVSLILLAACVIRSVRARRKVPQPPAWKSYREDTFEGALWRWDYLGNDVITNMQAYCLECDCALELLRDPWSRHMHLECVACKASHECFVGCSSGREVVGRVKRLIDQRIRAQFSRKDEAAR